MMVNCTHLAWVDLETTGLHPTRHSIIEIGLIVTTATPELTEVAAASHVIRQRGVRWDEEALRMHRANGLYGEATDPAALTIKEALYEVETLLADSPGKVRGPMCGSSVHFDRAFIDHDMPELLRYWNHRNFDVSTLVMARELTGEPMWVPPPPAHRALTDLRRSIEVARSYFGRRHEAT